MSRCMTLTPRLQLLQRHVILLEFLARGLPTFNSLTMSMGVHDGTAPSKWYIHHIGYVYPAGSDDGIAITQMAYFISLTSTLSPRRRTRMYMQTLSHMNLGIAQFSP